MGTRCLTFVYENNEPIINIYRQYDGYIGGHGKELAEYLVGRKIINGIPVDLMDKTNVKFSNGMGCFAAGLIGHLKKDQLGNIYINDLKETNCGQDYEYHIFDNLVVVKNYSKNVMFCGTWDEFGKFCEEDEE